MDRRGFTLIELLIVVVIIGLLIAMLLPAVGSSREAARLTYCRNNLRQVAIAFQQYHALHGEYAGYGGEQPPAGTNTRRSQRGGVRRDRRFGGDNWILQVMPFWEEAHLQARLLEQRRQRESSELLRELVQVPVPGLYCPSRRDARAYPLQGRYRTRYGEQGARTDYAMNGGSSKSPGRQVTIDQEGVWIVGRRVSEKHLSDGTTKTYLVGEKAMEADLYLTGTDRGDRSPIAGLPEHFGAANSYVRYAIRSPSRDRKNNCLACHDFGSAHPTVWNAALCDGSVRSLGYGMDVNIHRAFASIKGQDKVRYE